MGVTHHLLVATVVAALTLACGGKSDPPPGDATDSGATGASSGGSSSGASSSGGSSSGATSSSGSSSGGSFGAEQDGCGCKLPNGDASKPFCDRVCNGRYTDWTDDTGKVCLHLDCGTVSECKYDDKGSAYCG